MKNNPLTQRNTIGGKLEEYKGDYSPIRVESPVKAGSEDDKAKIDINDSVQDPEAEEGKLSGDCSDSDEESVTFYDAYDHYIYDEFEKEVQEENKRRGTDFILDHKRTTLPALKPKSTINIFKILKDSIGKDLTKF